MKISFKRPGGLTNTSTEGSADMIRLLGGTSLYGVTFTPTELRNVSRFYGIDPKQSKALADASHADALEAAKNASPPKYSWEPRGTVKVPTESDRKSVEKFLDAGTNLAILREATTDGLRLMAYLSHFLQKGEDPVSLVHVLCRDAGYDTGCTGFKDPAEDVDPDDI